MELKATSLVYSIVALAVMVMLISTIIIPTVENAQADQYSTANNTDLRFKLVEVTDTIVISCDSTGVFINGTHINISGGSPTIAITPTMQISYYQTAPNMSIQDSVTATAIAIAQTNTITLSNGTYTVDTATPKTGTFEGPLYVIDTNGDYANYATTSTSPFYINNDGVMRGYLQTNVTVGEDTVGLRAIFEGTVSGLTIVSAFDNNAHEAIDTDDLSITFNVAPVQVDSVHYKVADRNVTVKYTVEGVDYTASVTITNGFIAPLEYKYIGDNDSSIITLLGIIPMLLIIVAVLFAVRLIGSRN